MATRKTEVGWKIKNIDVNEEFLPPYPISEDGVKFAVGGVYAEIQRFGMEPISNWVGQKEGPYQFSSTFFAETTADVIEDKFSKLRRLAQKDDNLGRPPICVFSYGNMDFLCQVETVDVTVKSPRFHQDVRGTMQQINVDVTLRKYIPFSQKQIDPTKPRKESYYLIASAVESSYEQLAKRFYGNPLAGDRLRKRHPDMPMQPTVGAKIKIPAKAIILREVVRPGYFGFDMTKSDTADVFRDLLNRRADRKVIL